MSYWRLIIIVCHTKYRLISHVIQKSCWSHCSSMLYRNSLDLKTFYGMQNLRGLLPCIVISKLVWRGRPSGNLCHVRRVGHKNTWRSSMSYKIWGNFYRTLTPCMYFKSYLRYTVHVCYMNICSSYISYLNRIDPPIRIENFYVT